MKKNIKPENRRLLEALYYIDEEVLSDALSSIRIPEPVSPVPRKKRVLYSVKYAAALVACAVLMGALIPAISMLVSNIVPIGSNFGAGAMPDGEEPATEPDNLNDESNGVEEIGAPTERVYDGSKGLEYALNDDGKTASFIGFGTCEEENVIIASTFRGVPVTEMRIEAIEWGMKPEVCGSVYAKSITVSDSVKLIHDDVFELCPYLESIHLGASVSWIAPIMPEHFTLKISSITVSPENETYVSINGCLIEKAINRLVYGCNNSVIPDDGSVLVIGVGAFYRNMSLEKLVIPDCIQKIEATAFSGCSNLKSVVLPKDLESLGDASFAVCSALAYVDLNGLAEIPAVAFLGASALAGIKGLENVSKIGEQAFSACNCLTRVDFGTSLKVIEKHAFSGTKWDATVYYSGTVAQWNAIEKDPEWFQDPVDRTESELKEIICSDGVAKP